MDLDLSIAFVLAATLVAAAFRVFVRTRGRPVYPRVEREGASPLLGRGVMDAMYSVVGPAGALARRVGISANAITWASVALGVVAGVLLGKGLFGAAAIVATVAAGADAIDGWVARETKTATPAGEIFDTTADRYVELAFFSGLVFHFRTDDLMLALTLGALAGSYMVSYASAKAHGAPVTVPRGMMRRAERLVYLVAGVALVPLVRVVAPVFERAPLALALALITLVGNGSAIHRMYRLGQALTRRPKPTATLATLKPEVVKAEAPARRIAGSR